LEPALAEEFRRWLLQFEIATTATRRLFEDIIRNPLRLSILLSVYAVTREKTPRAIGQLLLEFFTIVFEREKAVHGFVDATLDEVIDWLAPAAIKMLANSKVAKVRLEAPTERERGLGRVLIASEIITSTNDETGFNIQFCHTLIRDFVAVLHVVRDPSRLSSVLHIHRFSKGSRVVSPCDDVLLLLSSLEGAQKLFVKAACIDPLLVFELSSSVSEEVIDDFVIKSAWSGLCPLLTHKSKVVRRLAFELCRRRAVRLRELVPTTYSETHNPALRKVCLQLAWYANDAGNLKLICRAISDQNRTVRRFARDVFLSIANEEPAEAARIAREVVDGLDQKRRDFWRSSFGTLAALLGSEARERFSDLVSIVPSQDGTGNFGSVWLSEGVRDSAKRGLDRSFEEFTVLVDRLAFCDAYEAVHVLTTLKRFASSYLKEIHLLAETGNPVLARRLPRLMSYVSDLSSIDVLFRLLDFGDSRVTMHALKVLSSFRRSDIAERARVYCYAADHKVRNHAVRAMANQDGADEPFLLNFLSDRQPEIRRSAVLALGRIGAEESVVRCLDLLLDNDENIRMAVCRIAARAGLKGVARIKSCLMGDESDRVRRQALLALFEIDPTEGEKRRWNFFRSRHVRPIGRDRASPTFSVLDWGVSRTTARIWRGARR
jgi:hypothetical protein